MMLLLRYLQLGGVLLKQFRADVGHVRPTYASVDHWDHVRWHTSLQGLSKHRLLDAPLLELVAFLLGLLLFLFPFILLGFRSKPVAHRIFLAMPLMRRGR